MSDSEGSQRPSLGLTEFVRRCTELALGGLGLLTNASIGAVQGFVPPSPEQREVAVTGPMGDVVETFPGALLGIGYAAQRALLGLVGGIEITTVRVVSVVGHLSVVRIALADTEQVLRQLQQQGHAAQARNETLAADFARGLAPVAAEQVVTQLDVAQIVRALPLDEIIAEIDLDSVIARLDLDAMLDRIDANKLLGKIDIDELMQRVDVERLVARIDVNAIVQRVDLDAVMEEIDLDALMDDVDIGKLVDRVDVNAVVQRVDLAPIAQEVLEAVDIGGIVRESTGSVTSDVVDGARVSAMRVDGFVARLTDRLILRRKEREVELPDAPNEQDRAG